MAIKFIREKRTGMWEGKCRYVFTDRIVKGVIAKQTFDPGWQYVIRLNDPDLDNKEIVRGPKSHKVKLSLAQAKTETEKISDLINRANTPNNAWILKGVMLGFTDEAEMEHIKEIYKKEHDDKTN